MCVIVQNSRISVWPIVNVNNNFVFLKKESDLFVKFLHKLLVVN